MDGCLISNWGDTIVTRLVIIGPNDRPNAGGGQAGGD